MRNSLLLFALLSGAFLQAQTYTVNVHPGQEALTIIQILADKYPAPNQSDYQADMEAHFRPFANHPAVNYLASFQAHLYSDFPEMGWSFSNFPAFDLHLTEASDWYEMYNQDSVQHYLHLAKDFITDSDFWAFYQSHTDEYKNWGEEISHFTDSLKLVEQLDNFYGTVIEPHFYVAMDPLNSWGAHAVVHLADINPAYNQYKAYSIGYWNRSSTVEDSPSFTQGDYLVNLIWHEGSHIYLAPYLEKFTAEIEALSYLYNGDDYQMQRQNIDDWAYCFEENLVRGIVISLTGKYMAPRAYRKQKAKEVLNDFLYADAISAWIDNNYLSIPNITFEEALSELISFLGEEFKQIPD